MNKIIVLVLVVAVSIVIVRGVYYFSTTKQPNRRTYPKALDYAFYTISEINRGQLSPGTYNTEGYVDKIYTCPPCPKDVYCKECMRDNIVISENIQFLELRRLSDGKIILFVDHPSQFLFGEKYRFSIKILNTKSTGELLNDIELVGYTPQ